MSIKFNINSDAAVSLTNKLEKLHKSALPVAIRSSLNSAAFDVKQKTMPLSAKVKFKERKKNFFKANSRVEMAKGFNVRSMSAVVGFIATSGANKAVKELQQQEYGGVIGGRSFVPMDTARVSKSNARSVQKKNRISVMPNVVNARKMKGSSKKQRFVRAVMAAGEDGLVLAENKGKSILWRVDSITRDKSGKFKLTAIYSYKKGRSVKVQGTQFMSLASRLSARKLDDFYLIEAKKQIKRLTGK